MAKNLRWHSLSKERIVSGRRQVRQRPLAAGRRTAEQQVGETGHPASALRFSIIVPCYNEEKRLPIADFLDFARKHPDVLLCFVNDGSRDQTLSVLLGIQFRQPANIAVLSLQVNSGKAEAVRQGMLFVKENFRVTGLGFLDADLATKPEEWYDMACYQRKHPEFSAITGSRISRLGAAIRRTDNRFFASKVMNFLIQRIIGASIRDSQCGAKIFDRELVPVLFGESFISSWLFDIELFLRIRKHYGKALLTRTVLEFPLLSWSEVGESKLRLKHQLRLPVQLIKIYIRYRLDKNSRIAPGF